MGVLTIYGNNYKFEGLTFSEGTINSRSRFDSARFRSCNFEGNIFKGCDFYNARASCTVYPDEWDDNRFDECSHGIHFFINAQEAVDY